MNENLAQSLLAGHVVVIPTDTTYGLVSLAADKEAVEKIFAAKKRDPSKPLIILVPSFRELESFKLELAGEVKNFLHKVWPGKTSVILNAPDAPEYLTRGSGTLAFRMPDDEALRNLLTSTGPLVAPSANPESEPTAQTIEEAKVYFGNQVDVYVDGGRLVSEPSTLVSLVEGKPVILRRGAGYSE